MGSKKSIERQSLWLLHSKSNRLLFDVKLQETMKTFNCLGKLKNVRVMAWLPKVNKWTGIRRRKKEGVTVELGMLESMQCLQNAHCLRAWKSLLPEKAPFTEKQAPPASASRCPTHGPRAEFLPFLARRRADSLRKPPSGIRATENLLRKSFLAQNVYYFLFCCI